MGEAAAPAAGGADAKPGIEVTPAEVDFGPPTWRSIHTMKNLGTSKICVKVKVFDSNIVTSRPTCAFVGPNESTTLTYQHKPFEYKEAEKATYDGRKVGVFYVDAPESATDAAAFAKDIPAANWKRVTMSIKYKFEAPKEAAKEPAGASKSVGGKAPAAASKSAGGKSLAAASKSATGKAPAAASKSAGGKTTPAAEAPKAPAEEKKA